MTNHISSKWALPFDVMFNHEEGIPTWLRPITAAEHGAAHREAAKAGAKFCQWPQAGASAQNTSKKKKKEGSAAREDRRQRAKDKAKAERIAKINVPSHIKVESYDSDEWNKRLLGDDGEHWKRGRGEAQHLWGEGQEMRQKTFLDTSPEDFIAKILSLNTDDKMQPIEEKFAAKFGSYKPLPYEEWADVVHALWMEVEWNPDMEILEWAKTEVVKEIQDALQLLHGTTKLQPLAVEEAIDKVTKGRNSGFPYFTSKWFRKPEVLDYYMDQARRLINGEDTLSGCPHILYKRVQPNGIGTPKMRPVECPPKGEAIAAKCLTDKFIEVFKTIPSYYGFNGGENVYKILGPYMEYDWLVESDFSKFDQRVVHLMPHVFQVIMRLVPQKYWRYLQIVLEYYQNAKLLTPIGLISSDRRNGLMSGEGWTSVIGTLANSIAVKYTMRRMGVDDYLRLSFGDDIAIATNKFNLEEFEKYMLELGMDCNRSKQNASTGPQAYFSFLGWYHFRDDWQRGGQGKFPMCRIAPGLYYREFYLTVSQIEQEEDISPETIARLKQSPIGIDMIAIVSKLNNCRNNEDFCELVDYVRENSPKRLSTDYIAPLSEIRNAIRNGRRNRGLGLANSPVVRYLYMLEELDMQNGVEICKFEPSDPETVTLEADIIDDINRDLV